MSKYTITVNRATGKQFVEVAGLGVFENGKTTRLTDEQEHRWFNRTGANPLVTFPEGIEVKEDPERKTNQQLPPAEQKQGPPAAAKPASGKGEA